MIFGPFRIRGARLHKAFGRVQDLLALATVKLALGHRAVTTAPPFRPFRKVTTAPVRSIRVLAMKNPRPMPV
jgi:hypothetical protein